MKKISSESISPEVKAWFGRQIEHIAMRHDLAGPQISRVRRGKYLKAVVKEFRARATAAKEAGALAISNEELDIFCSSAASELIAIRQTRADHDSGKLPTDLLRQLPAYIAFRAYLEKAPELVMSELVAVARELEEPAWQKVDDTQLCQPDHPTHPLSPETRAWMELHALGLALAGDAGGPAFGTFVREVYITNSALQIREKAWRAMSIGDLTLPAEDLDKICWIVACEAYLLRSLKAAKHAGQLCEQDMRKMPIYGLYKDYFENGSNLAQMATSIAVSIGQSVQPPGDQN